MTALRLGSKCGVCDNGSARHRWPGLPGETFRNDTIHPFSALGLFSDCRQPRGSLNMQFVGWSAARLRVPNELRRLMLLSDQ